MPHYKDSQNRVHHLDDEAFEPLLPPGCVPITDQDAADLNAPTPGQIAAQRAAQIKARLAAIDAESVRAMRTVTVGKGKVQDDLKLTTLDDEAEALRAELASM